MSWKNASTDVFLEKIWTDRGLWWFKSVNGDVFCLNSHELLELYLYMFANIERIMEQACDDEIRFFEHTVHEITSIQKARMSYHSLILKKQFEDRPTSIIDTEGNERLNFKTREKMEEGFNEAIEQARKP